MPDREMGVSHIALLQVAAVFSLWNMGLLAQFGPAVLVLLVAVFVFFLTPVALVVCEISSMWPHLRGGVYDWANEAFGAGWGFLCVWLTCAACIPWYPVVLSFGIGVVSSSWQLHLTGHAELVAAITITFFWISTFVQLQGAKGAIFFSKVLVISGGIVPIVVLNIMGGYWVINGRPHLLPSIFPSSFDPLGGFGPAADGLPQFAWLPPWQLTSFSLYAVAVLGVAGFETSALHVGRVAHPEITFSRSSFVAVLCLFLLTMTALLSVLAVVPHTDVEFTTALVQAFEKYLEMGLGGWANHVFLRVIGLLIAMGVYGQLHTWVGAIPMTLLEAARVGDLPQSLGATNANGAPHRLLFLQAILVTAICLIAALMPSLQFAFSLLSSVGANLYGIMYVLLFVCVFKLRRLHPNEPRPFMVPRLWAVGGAGLVCSIIVVIFSFFPPFEEGHGSAASGQAQSSNYKKLYMAYTAMLVVFLICLPKAASFCCAKPKVPEVDHYAA